MKKLLLMILCAILFASCATTVPYSKTTKGILEPLLGGFFYKAVERLGPPTHIYKYSEKRVLAWESKTQRSNPGLIYSTDMGSDDTITLYKPPSTYVDYNYIYLYVNENGTIYGYKSNVKTQAEIEAEQSRKGWGAVAILYIVGGIGIIGLVASQ